jgi:trimeric autotransporter adhesin
MKKAIKRFALFLAYQFLLLVVIQAQPNNNCANATLITTDSACVTGTSRLTGQTLNSATGDGGTIASSCTAVASQDVWYYFVAKTAFPTITVSNLGANWGTRLKIQLLEGSCGSFAEKACANNAPLTPALTNPLTPGTTYYIRIHKNNTTAPGTTGWNFDICVTDALTRGSRNNEVFSRTTLSGAGVLNYPWEVTYGPDNNLWISEARGYKVYKMNPNTGVKTTVLDLATGSTFLPAPSDTLNAVSMGTWSPWPQGGFAGLTLHPRFLEAGNLYNYVYVAYVHRFIGGTQPSGLYYRNKLVRFTYNTGTGLLGSPVVLCDTLPGSKDHNSQRMIIAPMTQGGTDYYLFYASGDMGSGQYENRTRPMKAQNAASYEGKILRFNLESDGDAGGNAWIPNSNPYSSTSAVYSIGIRNNQGFAYDPDLNILYGSSHGAYSDDEINIIEGFKNYGHPLIIGFHQDGNYNGTTGAPSSTNVSAGSPWLTSSGVSTCPPIGDETANKAIIDGQPYGLYKDPLFSAYTGPVSGAGSVANIWATTNGANGSWPSEGWSGLDLYNNGIIPGWKKSLVASGLKWGRLIKLRLGSAGTTTLPSNLSYGNTGDTVSYFQSVNRYRDLAFGPNGKDIYIIMDNTAATSGPGVGNPIVPGCAGCVQKYSFLGYADAGGLSTIPKTIDVTDGPVNTCTNGTTVTIDGSNNFLWVPITGPDGNILAEINAMGQSLGTVTSSFYKNSGPIRVAGGVRYLDRNITITPAVTSFVTPVKVRLYISKAELDALKADPLSNVTDAGDLLILKNSDACGSAISSTTTALSLTNATNNGDTLHGPNGYVLQTSVTGFSTFYFGANNVLLPLDLLTFNGTLQTDLTSLLNWKTENEVNTSHFSVERSVDGRSFSSIGTVAASINSSSAKNYSFNDKDAAAQGVPVIYYRLKMVDANGMFKYSNIVKIQLPASKGTITVSPNPASDIINAAIASPTATASSVRIIDNTGRTVMVRNERLKKGSNIISLNIKTLAAGSYHLQISGEGIDIKTKFQKL